MTTNTFCTTCLFKSKAAERLNEKELQLLDKSCVNVEFDKDDIIFKQDALSSNIIYLRTGWVKLIIKGPQRKQILKFKKAPCYLGLPTIMGDRINHYSAVAVEKTEACFIDINTFRTLLSNPGFSYEIIVELCKNELEQFHSCVKLVQNQIYGRLAGHLIYFADEIYHTDEFDLPLTRNEMANLVCTSRETISRLMTNFSKEKIISIKGRHIHILNKTRLQKISEKG